MLKRSCSLTTRKQKHQICQTNTNIKRRLPGKKQNSPPYCYYQQIIDKPSNRSKQNVLLLSPTSAKLIIAHDERVVKQKREKILLIGRRFDELAHFMLGEGFLTDSLQKNNWQKSDICCRILLKKKVWFTIGVTQSRVKGTTEAQRHGEKWDKEGGRQSESPCFPFPLSPCHRISRSLRSKTSVPQCLSGCFSVLRKCYHFLPEK